MNDFEAAMAPKSDQINASDLIGGDMIITIAGVKVTPGTEQPVSISIKESGKVWRPCKSTGRVLMKAWGADTSQYAGRKVQLYLDEDVKWGGLKVGGIRIRAISHIDEDLRIVLAESKQVKKPVTVKRLVQQGAPEQPARRYDAISALERAKAQAAQWPTPAARDHKGSSEASVTRVNGKTRLDLLDHRAEQGFSHPAPETAQLGPNSLQTIRISRQLFRSAMSNVSQTTLRRWLRDGNWRKRRLNPLFVSYLMGWPIAHALCGYSGTVSARCKPQWHGLHSPEYTDWSQPNGQMPTLRGILYPKQEIEQIGEGQSDVLRGEMYAGCEKASDGKVPVVRGGFHPEAENHEILQSAMFGNVAEEGSIVAVSQQEDQWQGASRTPLGYGMPLGAQFVDDRACPPQERDKNGQQTGEPGDHQPGEPWVIASPTDATTDDRLRNLRGDIHPQQDKARTDEHMLASMQGDLCAEPAMGDFLIWQRRMRGALSHLPMASGPWIWNPPVDAPPMMQGNLFD